RFRVGVERDDLELWSAPFDQQREVARSAADLEHPPRRFQLGLIGELLMRGLNPEQAREGVIERQQPVEPHPRQVPPLLGRVGDGWWWGVLSHRSSSPWIRGCLEPVSVIIESMSRVQSGSLAIMRQSFVPPETTRLTGRRIDGAPVYEYVRTPEAPPVS